jgi:hypothetical protein
MTHAGYFIRFAILAASILLWPIQTKAHEVPDEVTVLTFLKPEGKTLTLLVQGNRVKPIKSFLRTAVALWVMFARRSVLLSKSRLKNRST